jgi:integrase/recombinase XerD
MNVAEVVEVYPARQRSLGMRFESAERLLHRFCRTLGNPEISKVAPELVATFLRGQGNLSASWLLRYRVLTGLYRFAIGRGYVGCSPLPTALPKLPPQQTPYVYSTEELRRLLDATEVLRVGHSPQVPAMYRTLILLLYGTGMRIGEVLRLTLQDVDLTEQVITVRDAKFFKTRLVPIGPRLNQELIGHTDRRRRLPLRLGETSPFFTTRDGRAWHYVRVISWFQNVRRAAGIVCPAGEPRPPRLHDLRHTTAVHRIVAWYRTGQDVQLLLMTPDLLQAANQRFAHYAMRGDHEG